MKKIFIAIGVTIFIWIMAMFAMSVANAQEIPSEQARTEQQVRQEMAEAVRDYKVAGFDMRAAQDRIGALQRELSEMRRKPVDPAVKSGTTEEIK